jgi:hypothetical protein
MKHPNKEQWPAAIKAAVKDTGAKPSSGVPCAVASVRYLRDNLVAAFAAAKPKTLDESLKLIKAEFNELLGIFTDPKQGVEQGFLSNASAAAKAAGFATEAEAITRLTE